MADDPGEAFSAAELRAAGAAVQAELADQNLLAVSWAGHALDALDEVDRLRLVITDLIGRLLEAGQACPCGAAINGLHALGCPVEDALNRYQQEASP